MSHTKKKKKKKTKKESVNDTVARAKAMLAQTKAEGSKSFKGSSYDSSSKKYNKKKTDKAVSEINIPKATEPVQTTVDRAKSVLAQTQAQGETPYAGSTFEQDFNAQQPTPPVTPEITPQSIAQAVSDAMPEQAQSYQPDAPQPQAEQQTDEQGNVIPQTAQESGFTPSQGGQTNAVVPLSNPSVVDFLNATGQASDFSSRARLAESLGINGYTGTASQNQQLLSSLRGMPVSTPEQITPTSAGAVAATSNTAPVSTATSFENIAQKFALPHTQADFMADPIKTIKDITKQVFSSMGLDQANSAIKDISKELEDLENKRDDEIRDINDDPWLTEGVRQRQIKKVEEKWADRIDSRVNKLQLLESVRDDAQQQAQFALGTAISVFDSERRFQAQQTQMYYNQAQREFDNAINLAKLSQPTTSDATSEMKEYMFAVEQGFGGGFLDYKQAIAAAGRADGLTPAQINSTVNSIAGAFDNEPIVKSYNTVQEGYQTLQKIGTQTKSPADDIAFIYAFAKIMDPNSVVREGEYNTIQKYAQTWADNFQFNAKRIFSNTNFLTPDAKQKMLNALAPKVDTITQQYNNVYNQYQQQIQGAYTGQPRQITNYAAGNTAPTSTYGPTQPAPQQTTEPTETPFRQRLGQAIISLFD